jgi:hypothetical protein
MNEDDVRAVVHEAVHETLEALGIDVSDKQEAQSDFLFLRKQRLGTEELYKWVRRSIIGAALGGLCYALWEGFKQTLKSGS